jgi:hypothetical protein
MDSLNVELKIRINFVLWILLGGQIHCVTESHDPFFLAKGYFTKIPISTYV